MGIYTRNYCHLTQEEREEWNVIKEKEVVKRVENSNMVMLHYDNLFDLAIASIGKSTY